MKENSKGMAWIIDPAGKVAAIETTNGEDIVDDKRISHDLLRLLLQNVLS